MTSPATIVFDLDGTLASTAPDILNALNTLLSEQGLTALEEEEAYEFISTGTGAEYLIRLAHTRSGKSLDQQEVAPLLQRYFDIYGDNLCVHTTLYDGCADCLDSLLRDGYILSVCTNKPMSLARPLLCTLGIADRFSAICGRDSFAFFKPDPRHLLATIAKAGGSAGSAVLVGDSITDVTAARAAGIPVILATFGYATLAAEALAPDRVFKSFKELPGVIGSLGRCSRGLD
jgi:phosphoglycolate phosphatase